MFEITLFTIASVFLASGVVHAGPAKPADECKDVKKEVQSLQAPKVRGSATAFCSQYLDIPELTEYKDVFEYSTDFGLDPETSYPYTFVTAPPGTITETDTYGLTTATETSIITLNYYCTLDPCPTDWDQSTLLITANEPTPSTTTITKTLVYVPNPLPDVDALALTKACECLSIPNPITTTTQTYTYVYAPYTVTAPLETWTDYNQVVLEIVTITIPISTSTVTIPEIIYPHFTYTTEYYPYPIFYETATVYSGSYTSTPKHTKKLSHPTETRPRTTHVHPSPKPTRPPRKGKGHK